MVSDDRHQKAVDELYQIADSIYKQIEKEIGRASCRERV